MLPPMGIPFPKTPEMAQAVVRFWKAMLGSWPQCEGSNFRKIIVSSTRETLYQDGSAAFVGVVNLSDKVARYDIWAFDKHVSSISALPGEATLALHDNALPRPCLQYEQPTVTASVVPYRMIFAHLEDPVHAWLAQGAWMVSGTTVSRGLWDNSNEEAVELPSYGTAWVTMALRKRKQMETVLEELMRVVCHPSRLNQIGND